MKREDNSASTEESHKRTEEIATLRERKGNIFERM